MAAWMLPAAMLASSAIGGLTGKQKKQKGSQQQFQENIALLNRDLGPAFQTWLASIMAGASHQGNQLGTALQGQIGRANMGGTGAGAAAKGIGRSYAGNQALQARGKAGFEGQMQVYDLAARAAGGGPSPMPGPTSMDSLIANIGSFLLTQGGGGQQMGGQKAAPQVAYGMPQGLPNSNFFGYRNLPRSGRIGG